MEHNLESVFILEEIFKHEGTEIVGVYTTWSAANNEAIRLTSLCEDKEYISYMVTEFELKK